MKNLNWIVLFGVTAGITACGKQGVVNLNIVNSGSTNAALSAGISRLAATDLSSSMPEGPSTAVGAASASQVKSLKYYITEINLCTTLEVNGTGWMAGSDCTSIYRSFDDMSAYDTYLVEQAALDTNPAHYIDIMDSESKSRLNQKTPLAAGEYNYGIITWMKPIKLNAEVTLNNGTTLVTKSELKTVANDAFFHMTAESLVGHPGESEESTVLLNNGGSFFKFQKPLIVKDKEETTVDLVFNPDSVVKGSSAASNYAIQEALAGENGPKAISVPYLQLTPVVRGAAETTLKESYLLAGPSSDVRLEIYTVKEDEGKSIRGIDLRSIYKEQTSTNIMDPGMVLSVNSNADGSLNLIDWKGGSILASFKRLEKAGDTGSAKLGCGSITVSQSQICGASLEDLEVGYQLVEVSEVK
ncbi:MAG: hypothetical protein AAB425_16005 [Bdellovibrionota bacterium]